MRLIIKISTILDDLKSVTRSKNFYDFTKFVWCCFGSLSEDWISLLTMLGENSMEITTHCKLLKGKVAEFCKFLGTSLDCYWIWKYSNSLFSFGVEFVHHDLNVTRRKIRAFSESTFQIDLFNEEVKYQVYNKLTFK